MSHVSKFGLQLENTYASLPGKFFTEVSPARFRTPRLQILNHNLAEELGLSIPSELSEVAAFFSGQTIPPDTRLIAQAYAGHQFGGFTMLGDGRAILIGEHRTPEGRLVDIQFKGSGPTPYSRGGDGLAAIGPMLREYIISEAMHALGIPTTRSLAVVSTGENVRRERWLPGAVLTRVAASHIRVGTFEYVSAFLDQQDLQALADYSIARHYPELASHPQPYLALLKAVIERQASLIARWQLVGFVHGVMNTDNMTISGETIDYGPCAFLDEYHAETVFSSIDHNGRYAYKNQPLIAQWNLCRFAETLLPLLDADSDKAIVLATDAIKQFTPAFDQYWLSGMRQKLGLQSEQPEDQDIIQALLAGMQQTRADFTCTFQHLSETGRLQPNDEVDGSLQQWHSRWTERLSRDGQTPESVGETMRSVNPAVIPRNHRVEEALAAAEDNDLSPLHDLLAALAHPFDASSTPAKYQQPPPANRPRYRTFCGT